MNVPKECPKCKGRIQTYEKRETPGQWIAICPDEQCKFVGGQGADSMAVLHRIFADEGVKGTFVVATLTPKLKD